MPGKSKPMKFPEINSRNPVQSDNPDIDHSSICKATTVAYVIHRVEDVNTITWETVNKEPETNLECIDLTNQIRDRFPPSRDALSPTLRPYWPVREDLYVVENVPFKDHKMLVPKKLRSIVLEGLHSVHQGIKGLLANAR